MFTQPRQKASSAVFSIVLVLLLLGRPSPADSDDNCRVLDQDIGTTYSGQCVDGLAHGNGTAAGRDTYVGEFKFGKPDGFGVYVWFNGSQLRGEFRNGRPHGRGVHTYGRNTALGLARYDGDFFEGRMEGAGEFIWPNGWRYRGHFLGNRAHGSGTLISPDGITYAGRFSRGRPLGPVEPTCPSLGEVIRC